MDPTTPPENEFQLAFLDLAFALVDLFFNVITGVIVPAFATPIFSDFFSFLQSIFAPAA